jgi:hypothetical protein
MKKSTAIAIAVRNSPNVLHNKNTFFASSNAELNIWWFDIPAHARSQHAYVNLLMYDGQHQLLYYLKVESKFLSRNRSAVCMYPDNATITLYLSTGEGNRFQDINRCGDRLDFSPFLKEQYQDVDFN